MSAKLWLAGWMVVWGITVAGAQTRDEMVRQDKQKVTADGFWIYNDLDAAFRQAEQTGKPILMVLRCIPCHECVKLDDDLVDQDPVIRPLLEQFVCVRQVSTNGLDLELFQYDTDQSFAVFMLNADRTIYGRFGTRSHRTQWFGDVSLPGLARALEGALALHANYPSNKAALQGKHGDKPEVASPEKFPSLKDKFTAELDYQGDVAKSCIHCHQIGEAQREYYWTAGKPIPERVLFPYPHPKSIGLILDPDQMATVAEVQPESIAARAGLQAGDRIVSLAGQPPLSIADVQWVLHQADPDGDRVAMEVDRDAATQSLTLVLPDRWRQASDLSWRATTWALRRMVLGGMVLETLEPERRQQLGLTPSNTAFLVKRVGQYGPHAAAKKAGVQQDDVLVAYDGNGQLTTETELLHYALSHHQVGDQVKLALWRDGKKVSVQLPIQP